MACKDFEALLMGYLDKELSVEEQTSVNEHLVRCGDCRKSHDEMARTASILDAVSFAEPGDKVLADLWQSPLDRAERYGGLVMVIGGYLALALYGFYEFITKSEGPVIPRIAAVAIFLGIALLLLSVFRERLRTSKDDPYKEIER